MTGWCKKVGGSRVGIFNTPKKVQKTEPCLKNFANIEENGEKNSDKKLKCLFTDFLEVFLKEVSGGSSFRPLPPLIFDGQEVDLFKLFFVVRERGGYESVSRNGSWGLVSEECGFKLRIGVALKLVYNRYLNKLDRWLRESVLDKQEENTGVKERDLSFCGLSMDLKSDLKVFLLGIMDKKKEDGKFMNVEIKTDSFGFEGSESVFKDRGFVESNGSVKKGEEVVNEKVEEKRILKNENRGVIENFDEKKSGIDGRKRKHECYSSMLNWIGKVANDPCNPEIGSLPERHNWKYYDGEWKQILLVREAMLLKRNIDPSSQQSIWQKKQKMHPSLYDDECVSELLRCSQRLVSAKDSSSKARELIDSESSSSGLQSDEDNADKKSDSKADYVGFWFNYHRSKEIPVSSLFQAEIPEFCGEVYNSDSKWVGTQIWPLEKGQVLKNLIERDRIGKGRQELCGCQFPGSVECVRFHVSEKRMRVKLELGSAFYRWKFDRVGDEVALYWTREEENKFQDIVKFNISSSEKYFWDELFKFFPRKGRESLVSYYYNVFLLRLRGYQNRTCTSNIDSDNEESEFGPLRDRFGQKAANSPASIFCSPKKPQR
ncbi:AT-rich interactive domain-containing protein 1 [Forsythia ovata]|uniref:AT-rich interactive domain-containing protein 1 n=1 Tax=Forsythia ovata TaxID=205694 RepID=A0ABD1QRC3_9LAMI